MWRNACSTAAFWLNPSRYLAQDLGLTLLWEARAFIDRVHRGDAFHSGIAWNCVIWNAGSGTNNKNNNELACTGMCWIFQTAYMVLFSCFIQCNSNSDLNHMMFCVLICHYCCRVEIGGGAREACGWETAPVNWRRRWKWEQRWSVEIWCGCGVEMWSHHWL